MPNRRSRRLLQSGWSCFLRYVHTYIYCICGLCHPASSEFDLESTVENVCSVKSLEQKFASGNIKYLQSL